MFLIFWYINIRIFLKIYYSNIFLNKNILKNNKQDTKLTLKVVIETTVLHLNPRPRLTNLTIHIIRKHVGSQHHSSKAMFVSWNSLSGKPLSKLSCVCLLLGKLVNGKHFPVNREHFPVNEKHFRVKEKFGLVFRKVFSL